MKIGLIIILIEADSDYIPSSYIHKFMPSDNCKFLYVIIILL